MINQENNSKQEIRNNKELEQLQIDINQCELIPQYNYTCICENQAYLVCSNIKCQKLNPFICIQKSCNCSKNHLHCIQRRLDSIIQIIQNKKKHKQLILTQLNCIFQRLQDKISNQWDRLQLKFKNYFQSSTRISLKVNNNLKTNNQSQSQQKSQQIENKQRIKLHYLTGSLIGKIYSPNKIQKQIKLQKQSVLKLQNRLKQFQQKQLKNFIKDIEQLMQNDGRQIFKFNPQYKSDCIQIKQNKQIKCIKENGKLNFALMNPKLCKIDRKQNILKIRIRINKINTCIGFGICSYNKLSKINYAALFQRKYRQEYGYVILQNIRGRITQLIKDNNIIDIEFNLYNRKIKIINRANGQQYEQQIELKKQRVNQYCLAFGLQKQSDSIEVHILPQNQTQDNELNGLIKKNKNFFIQSNQVQQQESLPNNNRYDDDEW